MKLTLDELKKDFEYEADKKEGWQILERGKLKGDCDDYGMTAAYIVSDSKLARFWLNIFTRKIKFHYVLTEDNFGHLVMEHKGKFIDNWHREFVTKDVMEKAGFKFKSVYWPTTVVLKMIFGLLRD